MPQNAEDRQEELIECLYDFIYDTIIKVELPVHMLRVPSPTADQFMLATYLNECYKSLVSKTDSEITDPFENPSLFPI